MCCLLVGMRKQTVTIPKKEYELLLKCRRIIRLDFEEKFSPQFIKEVKESEEAFLSGNSIVRGLEDIKAGRIKPWKSKKSKISVKDINEIAARIDRNVARKLGLR